MGKNNKQLIVFINQSKFFSLFSNTSYSMTGNQIAFLRNGSIIIKKNIDVNNDELASSPIIIQPDISSYNYRPSCPFKILFHGETQKYSQTNSLINLMKDKNCEGWKEQPEEKDTLYKDVVNLIIDNYRQKSFDDIYQSIPKKNVKLEIALEFLHKYLGHNTTNPSLPKEFRECKSQYNTLIKEKNISNLRVLRDAMLTSAGVV